MGGCLSKWPGEPADGAPDPTAANAGSGEGGAEYAVELSSYEAACRLDPELRTFDAALQQHTSRAISSLATGVELRSLSFSSLSVVTGSLLEMNQEVVKIVLECKQDVWRSPELFDLVEDYFNTSLHSLDFCTALEKCLKRARDSQLLVHLALQHFDEEDEEQDGEPNNGQLKYNRTLDELRQFKVAGDPFTEEFFQVFQSVYAQQLAMLDKLQQRKRKLDQKLRSVKVWRRVSSIIFAAAFATVLICSVVAAAMAAPPVAAALAAATAIPLGSMGKWFDSLWKDYEDVLKGQNGVVSAMQVWTFVTIKDLDGIRVLIDRLELQISSLLADAEFALRNEEAVRIAIEEIRKKLGEFMKSVEDLGEQADRCSRDIRKARTVILQRIIRHPK